MIFISVGMNVFLNVLGKTDTVFSYNSLLESKQVYATLHIVKLLTSTEY